MEKQVCIESSGRRLFGMMHVPDGGGVFPVLILYHGFTGNCIEQHRFFVKISRVLSQCGIACVRFDFSGAGQSEGNSEDHDFFDCVNDAVNIYEFTRNCSEIDPGKICGAGFSMGAAVLLHLHSENKIRFFKHVYMAPAVDLPEIIPGIVKNAKDYGDYFDIWGNMISKKAIQAAMDVDLLSRETGGLPESAVFHCEDDQSVPADLGRTLHEFLSKNGSVSMLKMYEAGGHTFSDVAVQEELFKDISDFVCGGIK